MEIIKDSDWEILYKLYETPNMTKVADMLYISQPSLTKRVKNMEKEFGVKIINRTSKGVKFTSEGEYLAKKAKEYMEFIKNVKEGLNSYKTELEGIAFSELYTRAQSLIRSISVCGVRGKILQSNELIELLYMAYNRDEAETFGLDKALKAGFNELYSTAPDIYEKRMKELDKEIEEKAMKKARAKVNEAKSDLQKQVEEKQNNMNNIIDEIAKMIIEENEPYIGKKVKDKAIEKLEKNTKEGGNENGESQKTRGRKKSTTI